MHAAGPSLTSRDPTILLREALIADRPECHRRWKVRPPALREHRRQGERAVDAHPRATVLEVSGHQEGDICARLQIIQLRHVGVRGPD